MNADQYRTHIQRPLRRAFLRGELARSVGVALIDNPYRERASTRVPTRGSWSEAFAKAWAVGWQTEDARIAGTEAAATAAAQEGRR